MHHRKQLYGASTVSVVHNLRPGGHDCHPSLSATSVLMNIPIAQTSSEKLTGRSDGKFLPSANELHLTIKCGREKNRSFHL